MHTHVVTVLWILRWHAGGLERDRRAVETRTVVSFGMSTIGQSTVVTMKGRWCRRTSVVDWDKLDHVGHVVFSNSNAIRLRSQRADITASLVALSAGTMATVTSAAFLGAGSTARLQTSACSVSVRVAIAATRM